MRDSGERILCVAGGVEHVDRRVSDFLKREARQRSAEGGGGLCRRARRQGQAPLDPRSVQPLGLLHLGRLAVVLLAPDPRAALRARLSRRARGRASRRDEPLGAVLARRARKACPSMSSAPRSGSTPTATTCTATGSRIERRHDLCRHRPRRATSIPGSHRAEKPPRTGCRRDTGMTASTCSATCSPNSRSISQPSSPAAASGRASGAPSAGRRRPAARARWRWRRRRRRGDWERRLARRSSSRQPPLASSAGSATGTP